MRPIVTHAIGFGLTLGVTLGALLFVVARVNAEIMLNDHPPDIRAKRRPMTERTKRQRTFVAGIFPVVLIGSALFAAVVSTILRVRSHA